MRRQLVAFVTACTALGLALFFGQAQAAPVRAFVMAPSSSLSHKNPVEQQSPNYPKCCPETWVNNPTKCMWDVDDWDTFTGSGSLAPGVSFSITDCLVADWQGTGAFGWPHNVTMWVSSKSPGLLVSYQASPTGSSYSADFARPGFTAPAVYSSSFHGYGYSGCTQAPAYFKGDPTLVPIGGSNGGVGVLTMLRFTISNPTSKTVNVIDAEVSIGNEQEHC